MTRSVLRIRVTPHIDPARASEVVCEVLRDGEVVATIYGTYGGLQIMSERLKPESPPVYFEAVGQSSYVVSLARAGRTVSRLQRRYRVARVSGLRTRAGGRRGVISAPVRGSGSEKRASRKEQSSRMKWHEVVNTPGGKGLKVVFKSGESLVIAKGIDDHLHVVSSSPEGIAYTVTPGGGLMLSPKLKAVERKARNGDA